MQLAPFSSRLIAAQSSIVAPEVLCESKEVHQNYVPLRGQYRFRMKLHAISWLIAMRESHDLAFARPRGHDQM